MQLLNATQIRRTVERIAIEILEHNFHESELILAGINNNGTRFADRLVAPLQQRAPHIVFTRANIRLNPAAPTAQPITISIADEAFENKVVIVIDDVADTGRTAYYALRPLLNVLCKKVEIAVLVDRKHKSFPAQPDYIGLSLATTLEETIDVRLDTLDEGVYLR
jgi:pyrimidine operon attenuation protein / uracil phosphoribosyltransferase